MAMAKELQGQEDERQPEADEADVEHGLHVQHGDLGRLGDDAFDAQDAVSEPVPFPLAQQAGFHDSHHAETREDAEDMNVDKIGGLYVDTSRPDQRSMIG